MKTNVLSQMKAKHLPAGKHADGQGLWLVKSEQSRGKWVLRIPVNGKRREMGLGRWPDVSIAEAREKAAEARKLVRASVDPVEARRKARAPVYRLTVKQAVEGCFEAVKASLKGDGDAGRWMSPMNTHVIPKLGTRAVEDIDQHALKEMLDPIWHAKPEAARKALNRMSMTLRHAAALGLAVDLQATMKARALLGKQRHVEEHIPSLPYAEAPAFFAWLTGKDTVASRALRFLMLTVARTTEVRCAVRSEITGDVWSLAAERTKNGQARRVPLTATAVSLIADVEGDVLFAGPKGGPISDATMAKLMKDEGYDARPHGFRATFRTWAEEVANAEFEVKEGCLGHAVDSGVVGAYQRSDRLEKRRKLLEQWEAFLLSGG